MDFLEYELRSEALVMGERIKGALFRPCARTIRYSQITGALRRRFDGDDLHAAGCLVAAPGYNLSEVLLYAPRDRLTALSKIPLQVEFLRNVLGKVYLPATPAAQRLPRDFEITLGALISRGFGVCTLHQCRVIDGQQRERGLLNTRIPLEHAPTFGIAEVRAPRYGYLFNPTSAHGGVYVLSLFEGSVVSAPVFLLRPGR